MNIDDPHTHEALNRLLLANGVAATYIDFVGNVVEIPLENRLRVLAEMGIDLPPPEYLDDYIRELLQRRQDALLPRVMLLGEGADHVPLQSVRQVQGMALDWTLSGDDGESADGTLTFPAGEEIHDARVPVPALGPGYYHFAVTAGRESASTFIIVAPERAYEPEFLRQGRRLWGVSVQLFSLQSDHNWGIGDFTDLADMVDEVAAKGGDFILLNPLHALNIQAPEIASPYSPTDRRFLNPLYIDPADTDEFQHESVRQWLEAAGIARQADALRQTPKVAYRETLALKYAVFDRLFRAFRRHSPAGSPREKSFRDFVARRGPELEHFADYEAGRDTGPTESAKDPAFHMYLQWLATDQLDRVQTRALERGMQIGLIRDMAVGATDDSFEVLENPGIFCRNARIGAPPDHFNPQGQNWGLTPMSPVAMETNGFGHFIDLLRANMASCGALRLDHVLALMRLWWCPGEGPNNAGAYVHYNTDALFAILRLESHRAGCMIIGEDLGVVPPEIRGYISNSAILSNTIFYFERYDGISFKKPEHYNPRALAIITNHDVPTLKAWWNTSDLVLRREIGLIEDEASYQREVETRARDKHNLLNMLEEIHLLPQEWLDRDIDRPFDLSLCTAIVRTCARSASCLVSMQLDDLAGLETPVNIPGTYNEYDNWRRKVPVPVRTLFASEEAGYMLAPLQEERP